MVNLAPSFSTLVEERLVALGTNSFAAEQAAGLPQDAIRNVIRSQKKDGPSLSRAKEICDALGLEFYIGPKRELSGFAEPQTESGIMRTEGLRAGYLPIPWLDGTTRNGSSPFAIAQSWLASQGLAPDHLKAVEPKSMHLSFRFEGNPVAIIDTIAAQRGSDQLWAYRDASGIRVSRAAFESDLVVLFPGGDEGPVKVVRRDTPAGTHLLGQVVWIGGKVA